MELGKFIDSSFRYLKHDCSATGGRLWLNNTMLKLYGNMTKLEIDSKNKTIFLELELKGELQPIQVKLSNYKLVQNGNETFIELGEINCSREWMNVLLAEQLNGLIKTQLQNTPIPGYLKIMLA
jgi:hypothetical protein